MIDPADLSLVQRAIRNADAEQLRQIVETLATAHGGKLPLPGSTVDAILDSRQKRRTRKPNGDDRQIPPKH